MYKCTEQEKERVEECSITCNTYRLGVARDRSNTHIYTAKWRRGRDIIMTLNEVGKCKTKTKEMKLRETIRSGQRGLSDHFDLRIAARS